MKVKNVDEALPHICIKLQVHDVPKIGGLACKVVDVIGSDKYY